MNTQTLRGFVDELQKIASRGMSRLAWTVGEAASPEEVARWKDVVQTVAPGGLTSSTGIPGTMKAHHTGAAYLMGGRPGSSAASKEWFAQQAEKKQKLFAPKPTVATKPTVGKRLTGFLRKIVGRK